MEKSLTIKDTISNDGKWYTLKELAEWTGFAEETLKKGNSPLTKLGIDFEVESKIENIGNHRNVKKYSEKVLKALKEYQIKNGGSNSSKNKEAVTSGNISFIQMNTINTLLDNPQALMALIAESSKRMLEMKPKAEFYDNYCAAENLSEIELLGEKTGVGKRNIFKILVGDKVIQPKFVDGIKFYQAYADYEKYFRSVPSPFELPDGTKKNRDKLMLTQEGMIYFQERYAVDL